MAIIFPKFFRWDVARPQPSVHVANVWNPGMPRHFREGRSPVGSVKKNISMYSQPLNLYTYYLYYYIYICINISLYVIFLVPTRHPFVLEKRTPPCLVLTSFHENVWNMANRANFVKIVICVSFFETYHFLDAPSKWTVNITQLERNLNK